VVFWVVTPFNVVGGYQRFGGTCCIHFQVGSVLSAVIWADCKQRCHADVLKVKACVSRDGEQEIRDQKTGLLRDQNCFVPGWERY
jgi:hypothetical protein